jgi:hypothetical protein
VAARHDLQVAAAGPAKQATSSGYVVSTVNCRCSCRYAGQGERRMRLVYPARVRVRLGKAGRVWYPPAVPDGGGLADCL